MGTNLIYVKYQRIFGGDIVDAWQCDIGVAVKNGAGWLCGCYI